MKYEQKYDTQWLLDLINSGENPEFILFWGHSAKPNTVTKACFSQWWPSRFTVDGHVFETAEHWMMAQKAKLFGSDEILSKILASPDPKEAKGLGRKVQDFEPKKWDENKLDIVFEGNLHKFRQNEDLKNFLLTTQDAIIVEASPVDPIWGIGIAEDHENALLPSKWRGPNLLGFALMAVRDLIKV